MASHPLLSLLFLEFTPLPTDLIHLCLSFCPVEGYEFCSSNSLLNNWVAFLLAQCDAMGMSLQPSRPESVFSYFVENFVRIKARWFKTTEGIEIKHGIFENALLQKSAQIFLLPFCPFGKIYDNGNFRVYFTSRTHEWYTKPKARVALKWRCQQRMSTISSTKHERLILFNALRT